MAWYRYMIIFSSGMSLISAGSFNKPHFALDSAMTKAIERAENGDIAERIKIYESKA